LTYHAPSQSYRLSGQMSGDDGQVIEVEYSIKGEKQVRATMRSPGSSEPFFEGWTNGIKAWRNGEPCQECMVGERTFDALNPVFKLIMADQVLQLSNPEVKTLYAGRVENNGEIFDQIDVRSPELGMMQAYFEVATGLLRWIEGDKIGVVRYSDYREVGGEKFLPYRFEGDYDGTYLVIELRDVSLDELPQSLFGNPGRAN